MCFIPQEETSREPCLRDPHAKSKKSPFSWPGELSGLTCHAAYSGGWSCRRHSGFRLIYKTWERNIVPEILSGQGLVFIPYLEVNYSPLWSWGKSTFRRWACDGAPHDFPSVCWPLRDSPWEKRFKRVLPACLLEMGVVFPEFCSSRCGSCEVDSVTQGSFLHPISYYLKLNFCGLFF